MANNIINLEDGEYVGLWRVDGKLGEGGFGAVYKVSRSDDQASYALKAESMKEPVKVLKMEVNVLRFVKEKKAQHFCSVIDLGLTTEFCYLVMTLVGKSLHDLRRECVGRKFSMGCALSVGRQCLEALEELHSIGFLHRDVKPSNYAIGHGMQKEELRKIYLLDFGMCRQYTSKTGSPNVRHPRTRAGFRGTLHYASLSCHIRREMSRKDDIESWLYQQVELTRGALPWRCVDERDEIAKCKERCRFEVGLLELMGGCPAQYIEILRYVDRLRYYDVPDYNKVYGYLKTAMTDMNAKEFPYDWEEKKADSSDEGEKRSTPPGLSGKLGILAVFASKRKNETNAQTAIRKMSQEKIEKDTKVGKKASQEKIEKDTKVGKKASQEKIGKGVRKGSKEKIEKDDKKESKEKIEKDDKKEKVAKDVKKESKEKIEKDVKKKSKEKVGKDVRKESKEKIEKDTKACSTESKEKINKVTKADRKVSKEKNEKDMKACKTESKEKMKKDTDKKKPKVQKESGEKLSKGKKIPKK